MVSWKDFYTEQERRNSQIAEAELYRLTKLCKRLPVSIKSKVQIKTYPKKLAIAEIQNHELKRARKTALKYCCRYGFNVMPFFIFLITFAGHSISKKIPYIYEKWLEFKTGIFMKFVLGQR